MGFEELRAFLLVVDEGSFLSAATAAGVSRSTLRRQVDALEAQAGVRLLDRSRSGVVLTDAGEQLARAGRTMQREFGALMASIRDGEPRPSGDVRAHLPTGLHPMVTSVIHGLIRANWPGLRSRVTFGDEPDLGRLDDVDLAVWFGPPASAPGWQERVITVIRQRLVAHPSYLASRGTPKSIAELAGHDVLAWLHPGERDPQLITHRGEVLPLASTLATSNAHVLHETAHLALGIAWVPDGELPPLPGRERLVPVLDDLVGRDVPLRLAVPVAIVDQPRMKVFLDHLDQMKAVVFGPSVGGA